MNQCYEDQDDFDDEDDDLDDDDVFDIRFQTVCRFVGVWEVLYGREIVNQSAGFFRMDGMNGRKLYEVNGEYFDHHVEAERYLQSQVTKGFV